MSDTEASDFQNVVGIDRRPFLDKPRRWADGLKGDGGGGTFGGMPPDLPERVAILETHVEHIKEDVAAVRSDLKDVRGDIKEIRGDITTIRIDLGTMRTRVDHLPTKGWAVTALLAAITIIGGIIALAPKLQKFVGSL